MYQNKNLIPKRKFSEVLKEFLNERDRLNGSYYDNRAIIDRIAGQKRFEQLEDELDEIFEVKGIE